MGLARFAAIPVALVGAVVVLSGCPQPRGDEAVMPPVSTMPLGEAPPEFTGAEGDWIGGGPLTLAAARGRVVYVEFGFLS